LLIDSDVVMRGEYLGGARRISGGGDCIERGCLKSFIYVDVCSTYPAIDSFPT